MMKTDCLGDRMKDYESRNQYFLQRRTPVCIRVDMRAGHTFTKGFARPFDEVFGNAMMKTMKYCAENIENCAFSYCQSDEITFILVDYEKLETEAWFNYRTDKLCSIAASMATMAFNKAFAKAFDEWGRENLPDWDMGGTNEPVDESIMKLCQVYGNAQEKGAMFDARVFNIPKEEVANLIYWRQLDATRNSIQMVGQANFSHSELQNKSCNDIQDMLFKERNINWNDFPTHLRRGSCCVKIESTTTCAKTVDGEVITWAAERPHWEIDLEIPIFKNEGREYINRRILYKEKPETIVAYIN